MMLQVWQLIATLADFSGDIHVSLIGFSVATGSEVIGDTAHNWLNPCGVLYGIAGGFMKKGG